MISLIKVIGTSMIVGFKIFENMVRICLLAFFEVFAKIARLRRSLLCSLSLCWLNSKQSIHKFVGSNFNQSEFKKINFGTYAIVPTDFLFWNLRVPLKLKVKTKRKRKEKSDRSGIRTHASEDTAALTQRLRPLGHPTVVNCSDRLSI